MTDWKGQRVSIAANRERVWEMHECFLDTDTMADLFDKYPPSEGWSLSIIPFAEDAHGATARRQ